MLPERLIECGGMHRCSAADLTTSVGPLGPDRQRRRTGTQSARRGRTFATGLIAVKDRPMDRAWSAKRIRCSSNRQGQQVAAVPVESWIGQAARCAAWWVSWGCLLLRVVLPLSAALGRWVSEGVTDEPQDVGAVQQTIRGGAGQQWIAKELVELVGSRFDVMMVEHRSYLSRMIS